jgi:ribosome-associated translation inhibitor RaiA
VKVMITVQLPGKVLRAESRRQQVIDAMDRAAEKIEPQLKKYKETKLDRGHGARRRKEEKMGRKRGAAASASPDMPELAMAA